MSLLKNNLSKKKDTKPEENREVDRSARIGDKLSFASAEAFNLLRSSLEFSCPKTDSGRVIGVSSAIPHEGKSFTAANLAYAIAKRGEKVLLVDGDMRCPVVAEETHTESAPGLSNLLVSKAPDDYKGYLQGVESRETLSVLVAGDVPPNPAELIGSLAMKKFISAVAMDFDYVIVDLPPVLPVSDTFTLSKSLDGILLVVKHAETRRREVQEAVRRLRMAEAHILGFVYNGPRQGVSRSYRRKGYYHHLSYYSNHSSKKDGSEATEEAVKTEAPQDNASVNEAASERDSYSKETLSTYDAIHSKMTVSDKKANGKKASKKKHKKNKR